MQICNFSTNRQIFDLLYTVVMDLVCYCSTAWAFMLSSWQFQLYMTLSFDFINIFYDYIFQSEQFCCIIFHRAYGFLSDVVWSLIS